MVNLLTKPIFQESAVSKKPDLLTKPIFQGSAVSKKPDLLTGPVFQRPSVSKMVDLLTEPEIFSIYKYNQKGPHLTTLPFPSNLKFNL